MPPPTPPPIRAALLDEVDSEASDVAVVCWLPDGAVEEAEGISVELAFSVAVVDVDSVRLM